MQMQASITTRLLADLAEKNLEESDLKRAALHVLDWIACCALGRLSIAGDVFQSLIDDDPISSPKQAINLFHGRVHWTQALNINAALGNVLEMDDIHRSSILHPGPVIIPAALAMAQVQKASIKDFLEAVIWGYEITIRMGEAVGRSHYQYFHNTSSCAAIGAALSVSKVLKLSDSETVWALGNAMSRTGGIWQMRNEKVLTKQWHNAQAALSGAHAALAARRGLSGPAFVLEGPQGVFAAMSTDARPEVFNAPSTHWRIHDCSFKPWPACRHAHPAMDALLSVLQHAEVAATDVERVTINTYRDAMVFCDRRTPVTPLEAKFSIQHAVSCLLLFQQPQLHHFDCDYIAREDVIALRDRVDVVFDANIEKLYPAHYGARCEILLKDGKVLSAQVDDTLGDPEKPLSKPQFAHKISMLLSAAGVSASKTDALLAMEWAKQADLTSLNRLLEDKI